MRNLLFLLSITGVFASQFQSVNVPSFIAANTAIDIILSSSLADGTSFNKYGLFLFIEAPQNRPPHNQFLACYLAKSLPVSSLDVLTKVPDSVGPNDVYYRMAVLDYSGDPNLANYNCSFPYTETLSTPFNFTGGTSTYSQFEIDGQYGAGDFWNIPCSAYDCVRKCNQAKYPANQKNFPANFRTTYNCVADCPEVTYRDFDTYFGPCSSISSTAGSSSTQIAGDSSITTHTSTVTGSQTVLTCQ